MYKNIKQGSSTMFNRASSNVIYRQTFNQYLYMLYP